MHLGARWGIETVQEELDWANQIIEYHPDTIFIIGTHRYLYDFKLVGGRYGETIDSPFGPLIIQDNFEDGVVDPNTGEELFNELVSQHPNILMIHAGHFHSEWMRLDGLNSAAQTGIQLLTDYQSTRNSGDGWLRIYKMDFDNNTFTFETYSPTLNRYHTTIDHFVETIHVAYVEREAVMEALGLTEEQYFALLESLKDVPEVPSWFLYLHPDFDDPDECFYYNQYLSELFNGEIPPGFQNIAEWEGLWLQAFAANPLNPLDFSDWVRSPSGIMEVDYSAYFTPMAQVCSTLGDDLPPSRLDQDIFTFSGTCRETVIIRLGANPLEIASDERATLIVKDLVRRARLFEMDRGPLPKQIPVTLPKNGKYMTMVAEQPRFVRGEPFRGEYCLSLEALEASPETRETLEATGWVE